jgi:phytoene desaturase
MSHHALFWHWFYQHAKDIYDEPRWPDEPLFYANFPSLTDKTAAPEGMESLSFSALARV